MLRLTNDEIMMFNDELMLRKDELMINDVRYYFKTPRTSRV